MEYQFKVQIKGLSKPPVWRKISVPAHFTFLKLHQVIQAAFGWEDYHLFEFRDKEYQGYIRIAIPFEDDVDFDVQAQDATKVRLSALFTGNLRKLLYVYDFGDDWVHELTLEAVADNQSKKARCLSGKGSCPPEDCGGIYGYEEMKQVFQTTPDSEEANEYREWLGLDKDELWGDNIFDLDEANAALKQI